LRLEFVQLLEWSGHGIYNHHGSIIE